jgi:transcription elongation factor Elf1
MSLTDDVQPTTTEEAPVSNLPRKAQCPSCAAETVFTCIGEQRWPEDVARAAGMKAVVTLWRCTVCHTTITLDYKDANSRSDKAE